jgi:hypothetical protein
MANAQSYLLVLFIDSFIEAIAAVPIRDRVQNFSG